MQKLLSIHYLYLIPLVTSVLASLRSFYPGWPRAFRIFSVMLQIIFIVEVTAIAWKWGLHTTAFWSYNPWNIWLYDILTLLKLLFYIWFFSCVLSSTKVKQLLKRSLIPVCLLGILELTTIHAAREPNIYTLVCGNFVIVLLCLLYFKQFIDNPVIPPGESRPLVLIAAGTFLYHSVTTPFFIYMNLLNYQAPSLFVDFISINHVSNIIMYSLFTISFLCKPSYPK